MAVLSLVVIGRMNERMRARPGPGEDQPRPADALRRHGPEPLPGDGAADRRRTSTTGRSPTPRRHSLSLLDAMEQADPATRASSTAVGGATRSTGNRASEVLALYEAGDLAGATALTSRRSIRPRTCSRPRCGRSSRRPRTRWRGAGRLRIRPPAPHDDRGRVLRRERGRGADARLRALVGVHPPGPQDGTRARRRSPRGLRAARRGAEPR